MKNALMKIKVVAVLVLAFIMLATTTAFAAPGGGSDGMPSVTGNKKTSKYDVATACVNAKFDTLGAGNAEADPVLGMVPVVGYGFVNHANCVIGSINSASPEYLFSAEGFSKLYMDHSGVGRLYYRAYSKEHGWSPWTTSQKYTVGNDDGAKIQAIQVRGKGYFCKDVNICYKVVLSDGTVLDWAMNGQTTGAMGTDNYIVAMKVSLWRKDVKLPGSAKTTTLMQAAHYDGIYKDGSGNVKYSTFDGQPYTGWGYLDGKQYYFNNGSPVSGWAYVDGYKYYLDETGAVVTDLEPVMGLQGSYQIKYNKSTRTMYVMANDPDGGGFIIPFKTFMSTCGPDTPIGTYKIYAKYDWKFMHDSDDGSGAIYCQKLSRFYQSFLIHSLLYYKEASPFTLDAINYNFIDDAASGGCIRLRAGDAQWVYANCPNGTPVITYEKPNETGPVEKDAIEQAIPRDQNYDPTDQIALNALAGQTLPEAEVADEPEEQ